MCHKPVSLSRYALSALTLHVCLYTLACADVAPAARPQADASGQGGNEVLLLSTSANDTPQVKTPPGMFPAATYSGAVSFGVANFRGIRYASAPTGEHRWAAPVPPAASEGEIDATAFGSACPQVASPFGVESSNEDCLFLNVYAPAGSEARADLPVMVFFYGGAFVSGASDLYDPTQLVTEGKVIVVTANYRLGVLGYMASPELTKTARDHVSGNYGLQDQLLALQWVKQNIPAFGGDARNVTVFGESAGGFSTCALLVSPAARGLFDRAITESGPCSFPLPELSASEATGSTFTEAVGCKKASADDTVACLRQLSAADVLAKQPSSADLLATPTGLTAFFPNVDGKFIPQQTATALALGQFNRVPVISGTNRDEGTLFIALAYDLLSGMPLTAADYPNKITDTAKALALQTGGSPDAIAQQILHEYPLSNYTSPGQALATVLGDGTFSCPALITDQLLSLNTPTYAYEFADRSAPMTLLPPVSFPYGATHTTELQYLFTQVSEAPSLTTEQEQLASSMRHYWTQFASTGRPNALLDGQPVWPVFSLLTSSIQGFVAPTPALRPDFSGDHHCTFWQNLLLEGAVLGGAK